MNGKGDAYVAKSGGQGDVSSLLVDQNTNFDVNVEPFNINVDRWTEERKRACLCGKLWRSGRCLMQGLMVV